MAIRCGACGFDQLINDNYCPRCGAENSDDGSCTYNAYADAFERMAESDAREDGYRRYRRDR